MDFSSFASIRPMSQHEQIGPDLGPAILCAAGAIRTRRLNARANAGGSPQIVFTIKGEILPRRS